MGRGAGGRLKATPGIRKGEFSELASKLPGADRVYLSMRLSPCDSAPRPSAAPAANALGVSCGPTRRRAFEVTTRHPGADTPGWSAVSFTPSLAAARIQVRDSPTLASDLRLGKRPTGPVRTSQLYTGAIYSCPNRSPVQPPKDARGRGGSRSRPMLVSIAGLGFPRGAGSGRPPEGNTRNPQRRILGTGIEATGR